jgi:hypothetical protein
MSLAICLLTGPPFANVYNPWPSLFIWFAEDDSAQPRNQDGVQKVGLRTVLYSPIERALDRLSQNKACQERDSFRIEDSRRS